MDVVLANLKEEKEGAITLLRLSKPTTFQKSAAWFSFVCSNFVSCGKLVALYPIENDQFRG